MTYVTNVGDSKDQIEKKEKESVSFSHKERG